MIQNTDHSDILNWLGDKPELLEKLRRMREIERDEGNGDIERIELELLELVKSIGAQSFGRCVQAKESKAFENEKAGDGGRIHGKKLIFSSLLGTIQTEERVLRRNTSTLRPLARFIGVGAGGSTKNL